MNVHSVNDCCDLLFLWDRLFEALLELRDRRSISSLLFPWVKSTIYGLVQEGFSGVLAIKSINSFWWKLLAVVELWGIPLNCTELDLRWFISFRYFAFTLVEPKLLGLWKILVSGALIGVTDLNPDPFLNLESCIEDTRTFFFASSEIRNFSSVLWTSSFRFEIMLSNSPTLSSESLEMSLSAATSWRSLSTSLLLESTSTLLISSFSLNESHLSHSWV